MLDDQYEDPLQQDDDFDAIVDAYNNAEGEMPTTSFEAESEDEGEEDGEETLDETSPLDSELRADPPMPPPATQQSSAPDIQSELLTSARILEDPSPFNIALGLWCEEVGVSRTQYKILRDILLLLPSNSITAQLPNTLDTLKRHLHGHLPQLPLRRSLVKLVPDKLATMAESRKQKAFELGRPLSTPMEWLFFVDLKNLFAAMLRSDLRERLYAGIGEFRTNPVELWQSGCWTSSLRTTSGKFARYPDKQPIFPSDFVTYHCLDKQCSIIHLGRIAGTGLDYRDTIPVPERGQLRLKVQRVLYTSDLTARVRQRYKLLSNDIIQTSIYEYVSQPHILARQSNVHLDYLTGDSRLNPSTLPQPPKENSVLVSRYLMRSQDELMPLAFTSPPRGELELQAFGRSWFETNFDETQGPCLSLPLMMFTDGFGAYRNAYRSLMGVYLLLAGLPIHERNKRANVFPLTLGPHGSNFDEVIESLHQLREFDKGFQVQLAQLTRVCAFSLCLLGDMPQQQINSGFMTQRADLGCRFCTISADDRGNLDYDIIRQGRYHHSSLHQRLEMDSASSATGKMAMARKWGLRVEAPALFRMTPALDIIQTRPSDPAHSEFAGMSKQVHTLLLEHILTTAGSTEYASTLRIWPFPPGFGRLQSPIHHLKSYSLQEHARWLIIAPGLLRCWLAEGHLKPHFAAAIYDRNCRTRQTPSPVTHTIISAFVAIARSMWALMTDEMDSSTRSTLGRIVLEGRRQWQILLDIAGAAADANPRSRSATPVRQQSVAPRDRPLPSAERSRMVYPMVSVLRSFDGITNLIC